MKIIALLLLAVQVQAAPYFRPLDPKHLQPVAGALLDPKDLGKTETAGLLPLITHSPKDGCLLPSIVCEDWTPLAVGAAMNAGKITLDVAPIANVLPWVAVGIAATLPASWGAIQAIKDAQAKSSSGLTFSAGPVWEYRQASNKGYYKTFLGLALKF